MQRTFSDFLLALGHPNAFYKGEIIPFPVAQGKTVLNPVAQSKIAPLRAKDKEIACELTENENAADNPEIEGWRNAALT